MTITYHRGLIQGSDEWVAARCGMLTASDFDKLVTPTFKIASNDKVRMHLWEMAAQRIGGHVEPGYINDHMLRGLNDEPVALELYAKHFAEIHPGGFVTNDAWGFRLGCSPDGLVGDDGLVEVKSRVQKYHVQTVAQRAAPAEFLPQIQGQLLITGRKWCDLLSYCAGLPMVQIRVEANIEQQQVLLEAAQQAELLIGEVMEQYYAALSILEYVPTEFRAEEEMFT